MITALVAFGANLGPAEETYRSVANQLRTTIGIESVTPSPLYQTWPVGTENQKLGQPFINGAYLLEVGKTTRFLFDDLQSIQSKLGGGHRTHWSPRSIDLDLICVDGEIIESDRLVLPHPRMHFRWFVLRPAVDLAPDLIHPVIERPVLDLLQRVESPNPRFLWIGEMSDLFRAANERILSRLPMATIDCRPADPPVAFQRLGNQVVAGRIEDSAEATWMLVPELERNRESGDASLVEAIPAIDLRPQSGKSSLERLDDFLDSMTVGQLWEAHIE